MRVGVNNLQIKMPIGMHIEEQIIETKLSITAICEFSNETQFLDYSVLIETIKNCQTMKLQTLESLLQFLENNITLKFPFIDNLQIVIKKLWLPISNVDLECVFVEKKFNYTDK